MKKILFLLFPLLTVQIYAQTNIADKQQVSGTWKVSDSPFIIQGEAIVPAGMTLTIDPGVEIRFKTGDVKDYRLDNKINNEFNVGFMRINGTLIAKGKKDKLIVFTGDGEGSWGNVCINSKSDACKLSYCKFEHAYYIRGITETDNATGALTFMESGGFVENCIFALNGWTALNFKSKSTAVVKNCVIYKNEYGIEANSESTPEIVNCIIWDNKNASYINGNSKPALSYSLMQGEAPGTDILDKGNNLMDIDPLFVDAEGGNFRLSKGSPCLKKGSDRKNIGLAF